MKNLTLLFATLLITSTSQASLISEKFKNELALDVQNTVTDSLKNYIYYAKNDKIGGAYNMRGKALNNLSNALKQIEKEASRDSTSKALFDYFGSDLSYAKVTVKNAIQIHNLLGSGKTIQEVKATTQAFEAMKQQLTE